MLLFENSAHFSTDLILQNFTDLIKSTDCAPETKWEPKNYSHLFLKQNKMLEVVNSSVWKREVVEMILGGEGKVGALWEGVRP